MEKVQRGEIIKQKQEVTKRKRKNFVRSNNQKTAIKKEPIKISNNFVELKEKYRGVYQFCGTCEHSIIVFM